MAAPLQRKQLALDTNILFDLAQNLNAAHDFRETFLKAGYLLRVPPTVVQELAFEAENGDDADVALYALTSMLNWKITPFDLAAVGHGLTDAFTAKLLRKGLLPEGEYNDGLILAETSRRARQRADHRVPRRQGQAANGLDHPPGQRATYLGRRGRENAVRDVDGDPVG